MIYEAIADRERSPMYEVVSNWGSDRLPSNPKTISEINLLV